MSHLIDELLYPATAPYSEGMLVVGGGHSIYYAEHGNKLGTPVVYLHGGPGSGHAPFFHRFFDPGHFRIVVYDQRGAPRSDPPARIEHNSPDLLAADNEALRVHLGIDQWHVFGGSWGSTLALLYAEQHPERVLSLTLRGIFLLRQLEVDWFMDQMIKFSPEMKEEFDAPVRSRGEQSVLDAYVELLTHPDPHVHLPAAHAWSRLESANAFLIPLSNAELTETDLKALCIARMEACYMQRHVLGNRLLDHAGRIAHIPTMIIQGRYDLICPPATAWELHRKLANVHLDILHAGHSAKEPEILKALFATAERIKLTGSPRPPSADARSTPG